MAKRILCICLWISWWPSMLLAASKPNLDMDRRSELRRLLIIELIDLLVDSHKSNLEDYIQIHGKLPGSVDDLVRHRQENFATNDAELILDVYRYWIPTAYPYGYQFEIDSEWGLTASPPTSDKMPVLRAIPNKAILAGPDPANLHKLPDSSIERTRALSDKIRNSWVKLFKEEPTIDQLSFLWRLDALWTLQIAVDSNSNLGGSYVGDDGLIDVEKLVGSLTWIGQDLKSHNMEIRRSGDIDWIVVVWPKVYGKSHKFTYCQDRKGIVRIGEITGDDDCSRIPEL